MIFYLSKHSALSILKDLRQWESVDFIALAVVGDFIRRDLTKLAPQAVVIASCIHDWISS
jgi:hypothetical protein